jgi:hypothetical protein
LLAAGIDRNRIDRWLADGRLRQVYRGVYAVGHDAPSRRADYLAAVLCGGEGAVLSHRAAAYLMGLLRGAAPAPEITVASTAGRKQRGLVVHRVAVIDPLDVSIHDGIPITIVPRILLDLAPRLPADDLGRACHEAWVRYRTTTRQIEHCIARSPRRHGIRKLRTALGADVVLSEMERAFLALLRQQHLPRPRTNVDHQGDKVDCHWPELGVTVELISFRYHATRQGFEADVARRRRSNHVAYTYGDVFERAAATIADLRPRLQRS